MDILKSFLLDFSLTFCVAFCWGILFGTPFKALLMVGLLGGFGHGMRFVFQQMGLGIIASTLSASVLVGLMGILSSHIVHHPPVVLTMPACITMVPGLYAYRSILGGIKLSDQTILDKNPNLIPNIAHNVVITFALLLTLAVGISVSALLFRNKSAKEIRFDIKSLGMKKEE